MAEHEISKSNGNLGKGFIDKVENDNPESNSSKNRMKFIIIGSVILAIIAIVIIVVLIVRSSNKNDEGKIEDTYNEESYSEIDTIPNSEMNKARESFKQYQYIDTVNSSYILEYNLFLPSGYTKEKKYPLVLFIGDASLVDKDIKTPITETVGGPIWATDRMQKKKLNVSFFLLNIERLLLMITKAILKVNILMLL